MAIMAGAFPVAMQQAAVIVRPVTIMTVNAIVVDNQTIPERFLLTPFLSLLFHLCSPAST
jgi:hypothetical protein